MCDILQTVWVLSEKLADNNKVRNYLHVVYEVYKFCELRNAHDHFWNPYPATKVTGQPTDLCSSTEAK